MALFGVSNQLLQIDTGLVRTYFYNPALSPVSIYAGLGENQVLGQRYFGSISTVTNPSGAPAIFMLVKYSSTAQPAPVAGPAPVYFTDNTFTTVTGVESEGGFGLSSTAGYLMVNTTDVSGLTAAMIQGAQVLIQVGGYCKAAFGPGSGGGVGNLIAPAAGNWVTAGVAPSGSANGISARAFGIQMTAIASGLCDVLVNCDII